MVLKVDLTWILGSKEEFHPKLTLFFEDDQAVDAALSPDTRAFLKSRLQQGHPEGLAEDSNQEDISGYLESSKLSKKL